MSKYLNWLGYDCLLYMFLIMFPFFINIYKYGYLLYTILLAFLWIFLEMKESIIGLFKNSNKNPNSNNKKPYPKKHTKDLNYIPPSKLININQN